MTTTLIHSVRLITDGTETPDAWVRFEDGRVAATGIGADWTDADTVIDAIALAGEGAILTPGFIDIHGHGGAGASFDDGVDAIRTARELHRAHGTTRAVISLVTAPLDDLVRRVGEIADLMTTDADILGSHLEGPFLDPGHHGAHEPSLLREPAAADVRRLLEAGRGTVRQVTIAPELPGGLEDCARCTIVVAEAKDVSNRLALVLLPLVLGISGAAGYTATLQAGGAPVVALAAMPSSVIEGGVVVGGSAGTSGAVGGLAGDGGTTAGGSAAGGSAAGGSTAGAVTGIGALVGAGSAALVVAGVVAATTIVPGLLDANPMTSMPSASEVGDSSISTELEPGSEMNDKFILEIEEEPEAPHTRDVDQTPQIKLPTVDNEPTAAPVAPSVPGGSGGDGDEGTTEPVKPPVGEEKPPVSPPGEGGEDPEPAVPTEKATVTGADWIDRDPPLNDNHTVTIYVSGVPGTSMEAAIVKDNKRGDSYIADIGDDGTGVFVLEATQDDLAAPNIVEFKYVTTDPGSQFSFSMTVAEIRELATGGTEDSEIPDPAEDQPAPAEPTAKAHAAQEQPSADEPVVEALAEETTSSSVVEEVAPDAVPVAADETPSADATAPLEDLARLTTPAEDAAPAE